MNKRIKAIIAIVVALTFKLLVNAGVITITYVKLPLLPLTSIFGLLVAVATYWIVRAFFVQHTKQLQKHGFCVVVLLVLFIVLWHEKLPSFPWDIISIILYTMLGFMACHIPEFFKRGATQHTLSFKEFNEELKLFRDTSVKDDELFGQREYIMDEFNASSIDVSAIKATLKPEYIIYEMKLRGKPIESQMEYLRKIIDSRCKVSQDEKYITFVIPYKR